MDHGQILEMDTPDRIFNSPRHPRLRQFLDQILLDTARMPPDITDEQLQRRIDIHVFDLLPAVVFKTTVDPQQIT